MKRKTSFTFYLFLFFFLFLFKKNIFASSWIKYQNNPIIPNSETQFYSANYRNPSVLYENGKYKMWADKLLSTNNQ